MSSARTMCMVLIAMLAGACAGQETQQASKVQIRSECLIRVPQDYQREAALIAGTASVGGKAIQQAFGNEAILLIETSPAGPDLINVYAMLPPDVTKANALWNAVGTNLRKALQQVYEEKVEQFRSQLELAERQKAEALARLQVGPSMSPADRAVQEQLEKMVDLSGLVRDMPVEIAIRDVLAKSVNPPLKVTVVWQDLQDQCLTDPGTGVGIDGASPMKLDTALRLLLKLASDRGPGGEMAVDYAIDGGGIIIATKQTLRSLRKEQPDGSEVQPSAQDLAASRQGLINQLQEAEMDALRLRARRAAMEGQASDLRKRIDEAIDQDTLIRELQRLVDLMAQGQARVQGLIEKGMAPQTQMDEAVEKLVKAKIDLARQKEAAAQSAGGEQLAKLTAALSDAAVQAAEKEAIVPILRDQLSRVEAQLTQAQASVQRTIERDLAMRSLREAGERIQDLRQKLASLQPPTVTVVGAGS
jgi:hypothetical protein